MHTLNIAFVNELGRQFQRKGQIIPGLLIDPKVVYWQVKNNRLINSYFQGDSGAPIYCKAPATSEWILIGVTATQISCGGTPEVKVIPAPQ